MVPAPPAYTPADTLKLIMQTWQWHHWNGLSYLTCSLLEPWSHGFFTRQFSPKPPRQLVTVLDAEARVYRVKQVHGNRVLKTGNMPAVTHHLHETEDMSSHLPQADGIVTEQDRESVWTCTADCTPVLIGDRASGQVSAIHAGWRGTSLKIVPQAIALMQAQGSQLADLAIAMGPAITGEVYQVGIDVATQVGATIVTEDAPEAMLARLQELPNSPILSDPEPGKVRLDVRRVNALQLEQLGIAPEQIAIAPMCTYSDPEHFFSYRREGLKKVQWSGIISRRFD